MKKDSKIMELLAKHEQDVERHNACQEAKRLKRQEIESHQAKLREYLAKAKEADAKPGDALENADESVRYERAAKNTESRKAAAEAELAALPEGDRSSIKYELNNALRAKLSTLMQARKKHLSDAYARWGVSLTEGLWNIIPIAGTNDSLTRLRRAIEDTAPWTVDTAERYLQLLEEELE